jgi:hypothetical protein
MRGFKMTDGGRPFKDKLAFQIVRLKIIQIFQECSKFEERDKKALYEVMGNLLLQRIRSAEKPAPDDEAPPEPCGLTDADPTDNFIRPAKLPMVDVNAAFPSDRTAPGFGVKGRFLSNHNAMRASND